MPKSLKTDVFLSTILSDERWYRDGEPTWPAAPTANQAKMKRLKVMKRLRRFVIDFPGAAQLARRLEACAPGDRCTSGACPECSRAFQRWFVLQVRRLADEDERELVAISIVAPDGHISQDFLILFDGREIKINFADALDSSGLCCWAVGALDISFNDDTKKGLDTAFQQQIYAVALVADRKLISKRLRTNARYRPSKAIARPAQVKRNDGTRKAVSYGFKTEGVRRIAYWGKRSTRPDETRWCWRSRKVSLRAREHVEVLLWLDEIGIAGRLFMYGVKLVRTPDGARLRKGE